VVGVQALGELGEVNNKENGKIKFIRITKSFNTFDNKSATTLRRNRKP